ncbi:uncharacterized protein PHACADRAFT_211586 [Phanerochaete carnosa HHB-10118-sp]|uniref:DUF6534 domain-containing protein n=1 Tax=Phanerochaete carnosa (strain HHB-10118-sp) TaxID=650164 RepID=K5W0D9_PHACS|nr:uncharacterized protein PHACADRAFT_211586 [Phanerochaete carnosa HHB-10118-sp]EKM52314.1 hypothetical protein PHACADRAFT_211586 [Phanerochaete carnosa HHB-10118-sp]
MDATQPVVPSLPSLPSFQFIMGPAMLLICVSLMLFGAFIAQVYFYWFTYRKDHRILRILVATIWVLEALHTAFSLHFLYEYFVVDIGAPEKLLNIVWSIAAGFAVEFTIIGFCQGFFLLRLWRLSGRNYVIAGISSLFLLARLGAGYEVSTKPVYPGGQRTMNLGLSMSAFIDILIASLMIFYLRKNMTSFQHSRGVIETLMFFSINTGALTILGSLSALFLFNFMSESLAYGAVILLLGKLYGNSVMGL